MTLQVYNKRIKCSTVGTSEPGSLLSLSTNSNVVLYPI